MIAPGCNSLCGEAKLYYYDFLCDESRELIPESIINHIEQCQHCQEQIDQLEVLLSQTDDTEPEQGQVNSVITAMLELHFAYIDEYVTCETVRPYLPGLLDPALEIRIPTPITAHLDNCQQCAEDLEIIRSLNLNRKQLCRLSRFLAEKPGDDGVIIFILLSYLYALSSSHSHQLLSKSYDSVTNPFLINIWRYDYLLIPLSNHYFRRHYFRRHYFLINGSEYDNRKHNHTSVTHYLFGANTN